jgi:hypothetical protein
MKEEYLRARAAEVADERKTFLGLIAAILAKAPDQGFNTPELEVSMTAARCHVQSNCCCLFG